MITKEQIIKWATQYQGGDNYEYVQQTPYTFTDNSAHLKHKLLEAKMLVDRWDAISTDIIVHSSHKDLFRKSLGNDMVGYKFAEIKDAYRQLLVLIPENKRQELEIALETESSDHLWGADIHYSDNIPEDQGMMIARYPNGDLQDEEYPGRCIAVFPM